MLRSRSVAEVRAVCSLEVVETVIIQFLICCATRPLSTQRQREHRGKGCRPDHYVRFQHDSRPLDYTRIRHEHVSYLSRLEVGRAIAYKHDRACQRATPHLQQCALAIGARQP